MTWDTETVRRGLAACAAKIDKEIMEMRFVPPPGTQAAAKAHGHLGASNPRCVFDPEFIALEWTRACASEDFMAYQGRPGVETSAHAYSHLWEDAKS
jgi:hypothetical protein